jgi:hypothetical protein
MIRQKVITKLSPKACWLDHKRKLARMIEVKQGTFWLTWKSQQEVKTYYPQKDEKGEKFFVRRAGRMSDEKAEPGDPLSSWHNRKVRNSIRANRCKVARMR